MVVKDLTQQEDLIQRVVCETNSLDYFETFLETTVGMIFKSSPVVVTRRYCSFGRKRKFIGGRTIDSSNPEQNPEPVYFHVCSIEDDLGNVVKGDKLFRDYARLIQGVMDHLKTAAMKDVKVFFKKCGEGYHRHFAKDNGTIGRGYRLDNISSKRSLDISLCHIYYDEKKDN